MKYLINAAAFIGAFPVPSTVVDKYIKLSSAVQLKVLLVCMRNSSSPIDSDEIAKILDISVSEVDDAILYWSECGILNTETPAAKPAKGQKLGFGKIFTDHMFIMNYTEGKGWHDPRIEPFHNISLSPTREDVAKRGNEDPKIRFLLREAQMKFGRNLKTNEASTFVWLCDDLGIDVSVLLLLIEYAVSENKKNISFIEKTAIKWKDNGVETLIDAENEIKKAAQNKLAVSVVWKAFGIDARKPSDKEQEYCNTWVNEWGISSELLLRAYNICIDNNAKVSFPYINKILEGWRKKGYKTVADIVDGEKTAPKQTKQGKNNFAAYDLDAFEKMLNSD